VAKERSLIVEEGQSKGFYGKFVIAVAVITSLYHFCFVAGFFQRAGLYIYSAQHYGVSLGLILFLAFLVYPAKRTGHRDKLPWYDVLFGLGALISCGYHVVFSGLVFDHYINGAPTTLEFFLALILTVVLMEAVRRIMGVAMPILAAVFVVYVFISGQLPGLLETLPISISRAVSVFYLGPSGIFGLVIRIYSIIIFPFVLFSSFFQVSGASDFFIALAMCLAGRFRGGPAKVAIVASAFFGTISGAPPANVATTGAVSIPLMKRLGFKPEFAGAVEAVASNGGAITPPVMAIVAFIMAEVLGVPYGQVCLAAILPCMLYYTTLFAAVHLETLKLGVKGLPREELPSLRQTLKQGWYYLLPVAALVVFLVVLKQPAEVAALYAIATVVVISMVRRESRIGPRRAIRGLDDAARTMLYIGPSCGLIGVILGAMNASGIGVTITGVLIDIAGGHLALLLLMAAVLCFLMGMGLDPVTIYVVLSALVAPSLVDMAVPKMAAHFFIFYWGLVSLITPPVCVSSFVAAGIAGSDAMKTGWQATRLGIATFIIPFAFVYSPVLLLEGPPLKIMLAALTGVIGASLLSIGTIGYVFRQLNPFRRAAIILTSLLLIYPEWRTDISGLVLALFLLLPELRLAAVDWFKAPEWVLGKSKVRS
jgi:TRAP transporter 4TM/12TM fusion protein